MGFLDSVKSFLRLEKREVQKEIGLDDRRLLEYLGIDIGEVNVKDKNALKVETVFSCVRIRSEAVAKLPLKVYQEDDYGVKKAAGHYIYRLLKLRPNPYMSAFDFWKCIEAQEALYGNAYASIEYDKKTGRVIGLWPIDAKHITIMVDDIGLISPNNKIWYEVDIGNGEKRKLMPDELLHFKGGITLDGIVGISPIDYLRGTIENAAMSDKFINNFYKQGLQVKGLVQYVGDLDEKAKQNFREKFEEMSSGLKNSHRIALMPIGYQFIPISLNMHDAQFIENTELTIRKIASAFGIKLHQLNDLSKSTHHNIEQQQRQFYADTLQAILTMFEQELTYKLFLDSEIEKGYFARFNIDTIIRSDIKTRYEAYRIGIQGGFLKPNEAREKEELPPVEGGDQLLVNGSMTPITQAGAAYKNSKGGEANEKGSQKNGEGN